MRWIAVFLVLSHVGHAQWADGFSGSLHADWMGDRSHFVVEGETLRLQAAEAGTSSLWRQYNLSDSIEWSLTFELDFPPSPSNQLEVYLSTDDPAPESMEALLFRIGETGDQDALRLYRRSAGSDTEIWSGPMGQVAENPSAQITVTKQGEDWTVMSRIEGESIGIPFSFELDYPIAPGMYFGLVCRYTSTRTDRFYFDDISVRTIVRDTLAPRFLSAEAVDAQTLEMRFDELLSESEIQLTLDPDPGPIESLNIKGSTLIAQFENAFPSGQTYQALLTGIADIAGNASDPVDFEFRYQLLETPHRFDVIINEVMADPSPPVFLPEVEYVEIYNRSAKALDLSQLLLVRGSTVLNLPETPFSPGDYIILCDADAVESLIPFGTVIGLAGFPAVNNTSGLLELQNLNGEWVHELSYDLSDYGNSDKANGGWSLEVIAPDAVCSFVGNLAPSEGDLGGTPGSRNSVFRERSDQEGPLLIDVFPTGPSRIEITFDEWLDEDRFGEILVEFNPAVPIEIISALPDRNQIEITLTGNLEEGIVYTLLTDQVRDCLGNLSGEQEVRVGLPLLPEVGDLVVNEVLFDPYPGESDFVELFNVGAHILDLADLTLVNTAKDPPDQVQVTSHKLVFPGEFAVITPDRTSIERIYPVRDLTTVLSNPLPSLDNASGSISLQVLVGADIVEVDEMTYDEGMHHPLIADPEGVSLEKISPTFDGNSQASWQSAAESVNFGTPGLPNSQLLEEGEFSSKNFQLQTSIFSPDGDGFQDFLLLQYALEKPGYLMEVRIFDINGRQVAEVANQELLQTNGIHIWNGTDDNGNQLGIGPYMMWVKAFHPDGDIRRWRRSFTLARTKR